MKSEQQYKDSDAWERVRALQFPDHLRTMTVENIAQLCEDLRRVMIDQTLRSGGHLASNLGVVELTVAIHRVFDAKLDHVIFDVGHQCYVHKLLTGRAAAFDTLRCPGGLSGFPRREESEYDAFGTGHASTSLSAAMGFAEADKLCGSDAYTVVVLGDGALTGGMIHEAFNNCKPYLNLIVILNDNEMSISKNVGQLARLLTRLRTAPSYTRTKSVAERMLSHVPLVGRPCIRALRRTKYKVKRIIYSNNYFESMGFRYLGPADGHDEPRIEQLLQAARKKGGCSLIHLKTVKGRGYAPAEQTPDRYHGLSPQTSNAQSLTFSSTVGHTLCALAEHNDRLCAITAAMRQGTGLADFFEKHRARAFDVGIAEEHAVTFAAGLAANGYLPVVAVYSTFLQRAYDQILHDVVLQHLPVVFAIDRAGLNECDGATHHGIFDVGFLLQFPKLDLWECATTASLAARMEHWLGTTGVRAPLAFRYPSGTDRERIVAYMDRAEQVSEGVFIDFDVEHPPATVVLTYGRLTDTVLKAKESSKISVGVTVLERLRPDQALVRLLTDIESAGCRRIIVCEEGIRSGGVGMHLLDALQTNAPSAAPAVTLLAIDQVPEPLSGQSHREAAGLAVKDILKAIEE